MYGNNTEFGVPTDNDASDDFIITHPEYTSSFNKNRGEPNWVSYNLEASHFGDEDRCDCFTFDPAAAAVATPYTTNEYTNSSLTAPFSIDRGHLARSFDRTSGNLDNAFTFYFSNLVPQASAVNQGPWAQMENEIGDFATVDNKEVYIIAGASGNLGTLKSLGHVVIPETNWKVVVIMPKDQGLANVTSPADIQVLAVIMPNTATPNANWHTYETTVDAVEALSGYDLLSLLPDPIEIAVESNTAAPTAAVDGPYTGYLPGEEIAMSGAGSSDPDEGQTLTYAWDFGDGATGTGVSTSHAYTAGGTYNVQLIVTDPLGLADTVTTTATVDTPAEGIADVQALLQGLIDGGQINSGNGNSLEVKLEGAIASFQGGQSTAAANKLTAFLNELNAMVQSGRLSAADAAPLQELANRLIASLT
jgi:DNA/RNA endonuclease G (NUC1)